MKKRGEAALWFWVELVGAIVIVAIAMTLAIFYSKGIIFEELNIARDISIQINTLSSLPGDGYIVNSNLHGYSLRFINNKVEVFDDVSEQLRGSHSFVTIKKQNFDLTLDKPAQVVISKIKDEIVISENLPDLS